MTARLFRCNIINAGGASIVRIGDHLDHGEWAEESVPSHTASVINPGQTGHYQAESGGDIPIYSSLMTGTEGWVAFRTTNTSGMSEYFKISHCLSYWGPRRGATVETMRYDPMITPGSTEFDTRDMTPAFIAVRRLGEFSPHDEVAEFQSLPWVIFWSVGQVVTQPYGDFHWHLTLEVSNTAPPTPTIIPFSSTSPPNVEMNPYRFSSPDLWRGVWDSDGNRVTAFISVLPNGLLKVTVIERSPGTPNQTFEATDVPILKLRMFDIDRLSEVIPALRQQPGLLEGVSRRMVQIQTQGGNEFEDFEIIGPEHRFHGEAARLEREFELVNAWPPREMGGDYLNLPNGAVLEIQQFTAEGTVIGYGLRYVRPASMPVFLSASIDAILYHQLVVK